MHTSGPSRVLTSYVTSQLVAHATRTGRAAPQYHKVKFVFRVVIESDVAGAVTRADVLVLG